MPELTALAATLGTCSVVTVRRARRIALGETVEPYKPRIRPVERVECPAPVIAPPVEKVATAGTRGALSRILSRVKDAVTPQPKHETWLCLFDVHAPFHDAVLWSKVCQLADDLGRDLTGVVIGGDFLDMASLSGHSADSLRQLRLTTLTDEYAVGSALLDDLDSAMHANAAKHYLWGNHEDRYWREMDKGDRGKYGSELTSPTVGLGLHARGYHVQEDWKEAVVQLGDHLDVIHGLYCGVHCAKKHLDEFQNSVIHGHTHRSQSFVWGKRAAYSIGGLFDRESHAFRYMPRPQRLKWSNMLAIVRIDAQRDFHVEPVHIYDKRFFAAGRFY